MNCPNCGSQTQTQQQFCRNCGAALSSETTASAASPLVGVILAFTGILIALTGKMLLHIELVTYIGVVVSILGMMSIAVTPLLGRRRVRRSAARMEALPGELPAAASTVKLPPVSARDEIFSVTDNTTELLKTPASDQNRTSDFSK